MFSTPFVIFVAFISSTWFVGDTWQRSPPTLLVTSHKPVMADSDLLRTFVTEPNIKKMALPWCYNITIQKAVLKELSTKAGYDIGYLPKGISNDSAPVDFCFPLSPQLHNCPNRFQMNTCEYHITNHTLYPLDSDRPLALLGDYYIGEDGTAWLCDPPIQPQARVPRCNYLQLNGDQYTILQNGSFHIKYVNLTIDQPSHLALNNFTMTCNICYPLSIAFLNCHPTSRLIAVPPIFYARDGDYWLIYMNEDLIFGLGDFYISPLGDAMICDSGKTMATSRALYILYRFFFAVSQLCLLLTFIYQYKLCKHTPQVKCLLCHILSTFVYNIYLIRITFHTIVSFESVYLPWQCYVLFVSGYAFAMAAFCWLNASSFDVWQSFARLGRHHSSVSKRHRFLCYSIYAWGVPAVMVITVFVVDNQTSLQMALSIRPQISIMCWFHDIRSAAIFYYGPLLFMVGLNMMFFLLTVHHIRRASKGTEYVNRKRKQQILLICLKLFVVMGITWITEGIVWSQMDHIHFPFWYISHAVISLQGIAICVIITWRRRTGQYLKNVRLWMNSSLRCVLTTLNDFSISWTPSSEAQHAN